MSEDFLQYLWKFKKFELANLKTTRNEEVVLQHSGWHNISNSGPDFFDARLIIQGQKWAGTIEIHIISSNWYLHNHENDPSYDNVILHVVWEDDIEIFRNDGTIIPTLQLKDYVADDLIKRYEILFEKRNVNRISCEKELFSVPDFVISNWQERLYLERLEQKTILVSKQLEESSNNWEEVLFKMLAKNFGLKTNGDAFLSLVDSIDFSVFRKCSSNLNVLEALLFGQAGFLSTSQETSYLQCLKTEYEFIKRKYGLSNLGILRFQFFRLRPANFPTVRIAQLAMLYFKNKNLFSSIIEAEKIERFYELFKVGTSDFWKNHYTFTKESKWREKIITKPFVDLIIVNTIIPIKFLYSQSRGENENEVIFDLLSQLQPEKNSIVHDFVNLKVKVKNAMHSQAMIQQKTNYCDKKACLNCAIGNYLLKN